MDSVPNRFNTYSANRTQANPRALKYGTQRDEYFYEYRQPFFDRGDGRSEPREPKWRKRKREREMHRGKYVSRYGEHPASRGRKESRGRNKRQPGLGNVRVTDRRISQSPEGIVRTNVRRSENGRSRRARRNKRLFGPRNMARREYREYLERRQFEIPFHQRDIYDPVELEEENDYLDKRRDLDYLYRDEGYQYSAGKDGFGTSSRRQSSGDWMYDDEYRHGHAPRRHGSGKYGAR